MECKRIKLIRRTEVLSLLGISNTTLYKLVNEKLLPPSFSLGCRAVGWYEHELNAVIKARAAGKGESEIKTLIKELVDARQHEL